MPKTNDFAVPEALLMEQTFREDVLPAFNAVLASSGLRLVDYFSEVLGEERGSEVIRLVTQASEERSNACLTDEALAGVIRMQGFG